MSQAVNFLIVLVVLRLFVYKPVLRILKERKRRIEEGLLKAGEADMRVREAESLKKVKMQEAEKEVLVLFREGESRMKKEEEKKLKEAERKAQEVIKNAEMVIEGKKSEMEQSFRKEAVSIIKTAMVKAAELSPSRIDESLLDKALEATKAKSPQ